MRNIMIMRFLIPLFIFLFTHAFLLIDSELILWPKTKLYYFLLINIYQIKFYFTF